MIPQRREHNLLLIFAALVLPFSPVKVSAQGIEYVKANYTKYEYRIPMRDGVRLFTVVYVPKDDSQKYPILLTRIAGHSNAGPYGADQYRGDLGPSSLFAKEGYFFVYQDVRGRFMSEGTFVAMRPHNPAKKSPHDIDESSDTYDTIDWLLKNVAGNTGKVGLYGSSLRGFYTAAGMIDAHPALKAASPQAPVIDWFIGDDWHHNGALFLSNAFNYLANFDKPRPQPIKQSPYLPFDHGTPDGYDFFLRLGPLTNADAKYFKGEVAFWKELMKHGTYDEFWQARNLRPHLRDIKPAVLTVGGWFDADNLFGTLETFQRIEATSPNTTNLLVMGPWDHGGWVGGRSDGSSLGHVSFNAKTADFYREKIELPFFESHLKGKGTFKQAKAWAFETGTNQWRQHSAWPPRNTKPLTLYFHAQGRLADQAPSDTVAETCYDEYPSDPAKPVPFIDTIGLHNVYRPTVALQAEYMVADQRFAARRPDVLVYETEVLVNDVTLVGPITADLHVSTTGTDSDWIVKVIDVYPNDHPDPKPNPTGVRMGGFQQLVRGDVMRGKFRASFEKPEPFVPGQPTAVKFALPDVYHTFRSGHKIMVQVQSSWFPLVDRNPQTFVDIYSAKRSDFQKATQRLYRSKELPSRLVAQTVP
jgi:putative CocE/NonD family hydrolase